MCTLKIIYPRNWSIRCPEGSTPWKSYIVGDCVSLPNTLVHSSTGWDWPTFVYVRPSTNQVSIALRTVQESEGRKLASESLSSFGRHLSSFGRHLLSFGRHLGVCSVSGGRGVGLDRTSTHSHPNPRYRRKDDDYLAHLRHWLTHSLYVEDDNSGFLDSRLKSCNMAHYTWSKSRDDTNWDTSSNPLNIKGSRGSTPISLPVSSEV